MRWSTANASADAAEAAAAADAKSSKVGTKTLMWLTKLHYRAEVFLRRSMKVRENAIASDKNFCFA